MSHSKFSFHQKQSYALLFPRPFQGYLPQVGSFIFCFLRWSHCFHFQNESKLLFDPFAIADYYGLDWLLSQPVKHYCFTCSCQKSLPTWQNCRGRPPRVRTVTFASKVGFTVTVSSGQELQFIRHSHPTVSSLLATSCPSVRCFVSSFLQIPPRDRHLCLRLVIPTPMAHSELSPSSYCLCRAHTKKIAITYYDDK